MAAVLANEAMQLPWGRGESEMRWRNARGPVRLKKALDALKYAVDNFIFLSTVHLL